MHIVGADGGDDHHTSLRLHHRATGREAVGCGARGGGNDHAVPPKFHGLNLVAVHRQAHHPGHRALGDHHVVEACLPLQDISIPGDHDIQHFPAFNLIFSRRNPPQELQLCAFQLRNEAHGADVDAQHRDVGPGGSLGGVEDGSVPAKTDQHVRPRQLLLQIGKHHATGQVQSSVHIKGQTNPGFHSGGSQIALGRQNKFKALIPVGIGCQNNFFQSDQPPNAPWAAATMAAVSGQIPSRDSRVR